MKTKVILIALGVALATGVALHLGHEVPKDGNCPLKTALSSKK
ncbi:MAG: hypothetical protein FD123_568 [Bacteroidetes bacterium]|nr:MAG: hypothetical protein FD123_568 [Bacteroidota bacterium]